jgi:hypothetical protein
MSSGMASRPLKDKDISLSSQWHIFSRIGLAAAIELLGGF